MAGRGGKKQSVQLAEEVEWGVPARAVRWVTTANGRSAGFLWHVRNGQKHGDDRRDRSAKMPAATKKSAACLSVCCISNRYLAA
jgi:hypothetical protein